MFLFKLKSPINAIVGGGFFLKYIVLPTYLAWKSFGIENGTNSLSSLDSMIQKHRKRENTLQRNPSIGCIILTSPFFFPKESWIEQPQDWKANIVQGKTYNMDQMPGMMLANQVMERLQKGNLENKASYVASGTYDEQPRYGNPIISRNRIGQGSFRAFVSIAYQHRGAITGERTLPVLDAAHIIPYSEKGTHAISNGLLLRTDIHNLYDSGYIAVDDSYKVMVSKRLFEDFGNGKVYYAYDGQPLSVFPQKQDESPDKKALIWHCERIFKG